MEQWRIMKQILGFSIPFSLVTPSSIDLNALCLTFGKHMSAWIPNYCCKAEIVRGSERCRRH
jgi:hypothetical protein